MTWLSSPNVSADSGRAKTINSSAPATPSSNAVRRSTVAVRAIRCASSVAAASAIWRTPLLLRPMPATLRARSATAVSMPIKPKPAGPSITAIAFVRTMEMAMFSTDEPPIQAEDDRIWR